MTQIVKHMSGKYKGLSLNPSTTTTKNQNQNQKTLQTRTRRLFPQVMEDSYKNPLTL
jgi:hypothetical protein